MPQYKSAVAIIAAALAGTAFAQQPSAPANQVPPADSPQKVCQSVVSAEQGAKPYKLCLTKAEWDAKKLEDLKDANRIVCHYEQQPGTRFRSSKICMPASQWAEQRRLEREAIDKIQASTCVYGAGC